MQEIELKFLNVDIKHMISKLEALGATKEYETTITERYFTQKQLDVHASDTTKKCLRVRSENGLHTITFKGPSAGAAREEIELPCDDAETAVALLVALGFQPSAVFQKHRMHYVLGEISFEIDKWPTLPPLLEIEAPSTEEIAKMCVKLGLRIEDGTPKNIKELYDL